MQDQRTTHIWSYDGDKKDPRFAPDSTLWCLHCRRSFLARDARPNRYFEGQGCAYEDCDAAGFGIDIFDETAIHALSCDDGDCPDRDDYRDELLGIESGDEVDELKRFERLDIGRLANLLKVRAIDPDAQHEGAPSAAECMAFMCRWPEVTVHGHAVHPDREEGGGAVRIMGLACVLYEVDDERLGPLREAFQRFNAAGEYLDDGERLYCSWG